MAEGAIKPWGSVGGRNGSSGQGMQILEKLSQKIGFSLHAPINKLSKKHLDIILYGDSSLEFDGVIGMMEDKYRNTKSDHARTEIE
ncbi:MAG: hypothetical protein UR65_C0061G0001, partial [Candidatus Moranbacteria bacterium GW2011_GWE2_35_164]